MEDDASEEDGTNISTIISAMIDQMIHLQWFLSEYEQATLSDSDDKLHSYKWW